MYIYLLLIIFISFFAVVIKIMPLSKKGKRKTFVFMSFIPLFIISAFRSENIGNDTYKYVDLFFVVNNANDLSKIHNRYEEGYLLFNKAIYFISSNGQALLIGTSFLILSLIFLFIYRNSNNLWLSIYLFITLMFYYFTMSGLRQAIAMSIVVCSYHFILNRKFWRFLLYIIIASLFHSIAIVMLLLYPLSFLKFNRKNIIFFIASGIITLFSFDRLLYLILNFFPKYSYYLKSEYFEAYNIANVINAFIPAMILIFGYTFKYFKASDVDEKVGNKLLANENHFLSFIILIGTLVSFVSIEASVIDRVYYYFSIFIIIYIPKVLNTIKEPKSRNLLTFFVVFMTFLYNLTIFLVRPEWNNVFPYYFFWD